MPKTTEARRTRLSADERRRSILDAARKAFSATGDMNGTTMRTIADRAGISEGVIYRHFESKDQLFYEAVVEPLHAAVEALVAATEQIDHDVPLNAERQQKALRLLYRELTGTFDEMLPLLGLVLFGDPKVARRFYREHFAVAIDRLAEAWAEVARRYGSKDSELSAISARVVVGSALILALEGTYAKDGMDRDRAFDDVRAGMFHGFFSLIES